MGILRWSFAGLVALLFGSSFALLSGSLILASVAAVSVLLIAAYLSREARPMDSVTQKGSRAPQSSAAAAYGAAHADPPDGGASAGGDCGFGGDGGGGASGC